VLETNKTHAIDAFEGLSLLPDKCIDLIVTDPPYNIKKAAWDNIPDYNAWMGRLFGECERVLKDNGSFYWFHNDMQVIAQLMEWLRINTGFVFKQMITWNKISESFTNYGFVQQRLSIDMMRNYYNGFTEYILFYTFQDETGLKTVMLDMNNFTTLRQYFKEFQEALGINKKEIIGKIGQQADHCFRWGSSQWDLPTEETYQELCKLTLKHEFVRREYEDLRREYEFVRREYEDLRREYEDLRYTFNAQWVKDDLRSNSNTWLYPPAERNGHATPKQIELIKNIILHSSNEGDLILDCFMGSGTTAKACEETGRNYIGFEKDACEYIESQTKLELFG